MLAVASVALATLSYWLIERPFRRISLPSHKIVLAGVASCLALFCAAAYIHSADGSPDRMPPEYFETRSLDVMWEWHCRYEEVGITAPNEDLRCTFGPPWNDGKHKAVLWGDSNAEHLMPILEYGAINSQTSVALIRACPATTDGRLKLRPDMQENPHDNVETRQKILDFIAQSKDIDTVLLSASWTFYFNDIDSTDPARTFELALDDLLSSLAQMHKHIILIGTVPQWQKNPPLCMFGQGLIRRPCVGQTIVSSLNEAEQAPSIAILQRISARYPSSQ